MSSDEKKLLRLSLQFGWVILMNDYAKSQTQSVRTETDGNAGCQPDPRRQTGTELHSGSDGSFGVGVDGTPRPGTNQNFVVLLTGGILSQLIADAEDRLGKTRECIEWYEREENEDLTRLENLKKLQRLAEQQQQANGNQETE